MEPEKPLPPLLRNVFPPLIFEPKVYDALAEAPLLDKDIALKPCMYNKGHNILMTPTDRVQQIGLLPGRKKMVINSRRLSHIGDTEQNTRKIPWMHLLAL